MKAATTPRLAPLAPPYRPELADELSQMMPPGVPPIALFRTLARNPRILRKIRLGNLLDRGSISLREREIVILRTTARCGASYEWGVHVAAFATKAKLSPAQIEASAGGDASAAAWSSHELLLLRVVDELHDAQTLSDATYAAAREVWSEEQLIELITLAGSYHTISFLVNALAIEPEPFAPALPRR